MGFVSQLRLLLWKNLLLQKKKWKVGIFEILLPVLFAVLILVTRKFTKPTQHTNATIYEDDVFNTRRLVNSSLLFSLRLLPKQGVPTLQLGYVPNSTVTSRVMQAVVQGLLEEATKAMMPDLANTNLWYLHATNQTIEAILKQKVVAKPFSTEAAMQDYYVIHSWDMPFGVVFNGLTDHNDSLPATVNINIRPRTADTQTWHTASTFPFMQDGGPGTGGDPVYQQSGFLVIQTLLSEAVMAEWLRSSGQQSKVALAVWQQRMPYPPYVQDPMITVLQTQLPLFLVLSFILSVIQSSKNIVYEKERKLKESMKLMGLMPIAHWVSWFITCYVYLLVAMAIYTALFGINIIRDSGPVLAHSDPSLFYVFLLCYAAAIVSFCFMISVIFQKANVAAAAAGLLFFGFYMPNFFLVDHYDTMTASQKLTASLLFNQAMSFGANVIGRWEGTGEGARWGNIYKHASVDDNFSLLDSMIMMLIDTAIHLVVTWYLDNVRPGEFGVPKPLYFCFTRSYWCTGRNGSDSVSEVSKTKQDEKQFERDPVGLKAGIKICNLRKKYKKNKVAVENLSLNMYEGQITVLLGHNGAGKTTTMSMLTGFIPPTSGTAYIDDKDIRTDIASVRTSLGLCPQHNILFGSLSVREHLIFFAKLKGCPDDQVMAEVERLVREVGLQHKQDAPSRTLSGGQKRKLSVAIALIAGSKIVILDEPSSGMDPAARRQIWDLLQRHRDGRTILLTTHFMDEADVLGDRIAVMAEGVVKCCGTPLFLKKLYGAGYHLVLVKGASCAVSAITQLITTSIPGARFESEMAAELTYLMPDDRSKLFAPLLRELEARKAELGVLHFGASATTLEEVFLKVGENAGAEEDDQTANGVGGIANGSFTPDDGVILVSHKNKGQGQNGNDSQHSGIRNLTLATDVLAFSRGYHKLQGTALARSRLRAMVVKKAIHCWRNRTITAVQLLLPVIFTIIALAIDKLRPQTLVEPQLTFNLSPFGRTVVGHGNESGPSLASTRYKDLIGNDQDTETVSLSQQNMTSWFLAKARDMGTASYNKKVIVGAQFHNASPDGTTQSATSWYNGQAYHAEPISLVFTLNAMAQSVVNTSVVINLGINPFPKDEDAANDRNVLLALATGFSVGFCISIGMAFLTSSFIHFLIKERSSGAKHIQMVSGAGPVIFWVSNLLWDYVNYLLPSLLLLAVFAAYGTEAFVQDHRLGLVVIILGLFGLAILPFIYFVHFAFKSAPSGMVVMIVFNIFSGLITMLTVFIMGIIDDVKDLGQQLNWVFLVLFPNHCMAKSFMDIYTNFLISKTCLDLNYKQLCQQRSNQCCKNIGLGCGDGNVCLNFTSNYLDWESPGIGRYLVFMAIQGSVFWTLTLLLEYRILQKVLDCFCCTGRSRMSDTNQQLRHINGSMLSSEDDDVAAERRRINASPASVLSQREPLLLVNLYKQYGGFVAVDHTCVGVPEQECFGLLGQNGAGKTTTFKMLTGDMPVSGGNAYLKGYDIKYNLQQVQSNMGYCPQFDALIEQMTGRETLTMYARLRGVPELHIRTCVNSLIDVLLLRPHADKLTSDYSGGNKRKLSTAIALVGDPPFILLDEPSSGMDPGARRQLWNVLSQVRASGRTLVLTSHSMEECEALCTRIAIMVNGRFVCLGSQQHLKSKFGQGYTLIAKMASVTQAQHDDVTEATLVVAPTEPFVSYVQDCFPGAKLFDSHQGYAHMQVPDPSVRLADVFEVMERAKDELHVEDYHVHQTTLEQVFLAFTARQQPPKEEKKRSCFRCK